MLNKRYLVRIGVAVVVLAGGLATRTVGEERLAGVAFSDPEGTPQTFFEQPGAPVKTAPSGFFQYQATLTTLNPVETPYLKRVTLSAL